MRFQPCARGRKNGGRRRKFDPFPVSSFERGVRATIAPNVSDTFHKFSPSSERRNKLFYGFVAIARINERNEQKAGEQKFDAIFGHLSKLQMFRSTVDERVELTTSGTGEEQSISSEGKVDRVFLHCSRGFGILLRFSFDRRCSSITETRRNYGIVNARRSFRVNVPRWIKITTNDRRLSEESSRLELLLRVSARLQHGVTRKEIGDHPFVASVVRVDSLERKGIINFLFLIRYNFYYAIWNDFDDLSNRDNDIAKTTSRRNVANSIFSREIIKN